MSIGELQLLWMDKNSEQVLASLRLYFLPENTPDGRNDDHGEDEVLAISEKVVLKVEDLLDRIMQDADWSHGLTASWDADCDADDEYDGKHQMLFDSAFDFDDIIKEKQLIGDKRSANSSSVIVLSYPRYCRYRGIMKRLEGVANKWSRHALVVALGGFAAPCRDTRVVFCKDTFDYPDLEGLELLCNHLAPNLKGRPRRKRKKRSVSPGGSESNESESSLSTVSSIAKIKPPVNRNGIRCGNLNQPRRSNRVVSPCVEEKDFLVKLHGFMKSKRTPIGRVPNLGFKEIDLFAFYKRVQKLGGYNSVTTNKMWKLIYDEMGGDPRSTSAATCTRRHYERLLLQYELNMRGLKTKPHSSTYYHDSDYEDDELSSPTYPKANTSSDSDNKNMIGSCGQKDKSIMSALRSVRTKGDKSLDCSGGAPLPPDKENIPLSNVSDGVDVKVEVVGESSSQSREKPEVEVIDISDQDSPVKVGKPSLPALKKRKLEILKEGGLEVTAILSGGESSERRPSVIQLATPVQRAEGHISITVTPDVSHMLGSPVEVSPPTSYEAYAHQRGGFVAVPESKRAARQGFAAWDAPRVTQSRSMYSHSESTVYGNPKAGLVPATRSAPVRPPPAVEILDLRVTPPCAPREHARGSRKPASLPIIDGRTLLGSNLEITVVDVNNKSHAQQLVRHSQTQRKTSSHRPVARNENDRQNDRQQSHRSDVAEVSNSRQVLPTASRRPSVPSNGRAGSRDPSRVRSQPQTATNSSPQQHASAFQPSLLAQLESRGSGKSNPAYNMPLINPMYYSTIYNSHMYQSPSNFMTQLPVQPSPPIFAPTPEHFQLYKDWMSHPVQTIMRTQQSTAGFLGLPRDGSTSITPVSQASTPTTK